MEEKVNIWKVCLIYGVIMGITGITYYILMHYSDLNISGNIFMTFQIVLLANFLKLYRNNYCSGNITFRQSFIVGLIIFFYYAIIMTIFRYILFDIIDTGLIDKEIAIYEKSLIEQNLSQELIDMFMKDIRGNLNFRNIMLGVGDLIWGIVVSFVTILTINIITIISFRLSGLFNKNKSINI